MLDVPPRAARDPDALLARFRSSGDPADLGALFDATAADLFRVALATAPDAATAEDALQETFLAVISAAARFDPSRRAMPWLLGILRFKVGRLRERTRRGANPRLGAPPPPAREEDPANACDPEEAGRAWGEIERLDEPYRAAALLRWRYGLSPAEIAHVRGEPPGTTRSILSRALDRLRRSTKVAPAVLAHGSRDAHGLDAVRSALVSHASTVGIGAGAGSALAAAGGTLAMKKVVVAAAVLLLLVGAGWVALRGGDRGPTQGPDAPPSVADADAPDRAATLAAADPKASVPAASPAASERPRASGRVVDREGKPVPGARVTSWPEDADSFVVPDGVGETPSTDLLAVADAEGRFVVPLDPGEPYHYVFAIADGFAPTVAGPLRAGGEATVILGRGATLSGRVLSGGAVEPSGAAIPGARVTALCLHGFFRFERRAVADGDGRYRIEGLPRPTFPTSLSVSVMTWLEVAADGWATAIVKAERAADDATLDVVLRRGWTLKGRVLDGDSGLPVPGAEVVFVSRDSQHGVRVLRWPDAAEATVEGPYTDRVVHRSVASPDGAFTVWGVPSLDERRPFAGDLVARAPGRLPSSLGVRREEDGSVQEVAIRLWRAGLALHGRVVAAGGAPAVGVRGRATVEGTSPAAWPGEPLDARGSAALGAFVTDSEGRYRVAGLPGPSGAAVTAKVTLWRASPVARTVELRAGEDVEVPNIEVPGPPSSSPLAELRFRVVDARGNPVWGAHLTYTVTSILYEPGARTERSGIAVLRVPADALAGDGPSVHVHAPGFAQVGLTVGRDAASGEKTVVLARGERIAGRVVAADGTAARGALVCARPPASGLEPPCSMTDGDGAFEIADLAGGSWHVTATKHRRVSTTGADRVLAVTAESVATGTTDLLLRLPPDDTPTTAHVEGTIRDAESGEVPKQFYVRFRRGSNEVVWAKGTGPGRFAADIPHGTWRVRVMADGWPLTIVEGYEVREGSPPPPLDVRLARGVPVSGRVTGVPAGVESPKLGFFATDGERSGASAPVAADGTYVVPGLAAGAYRVVLGGEGGARPGNGDDVAAWAPADGEILDVPAGAKEARFDVRLAAAGALTVTVEGPRVPPEAGKGVAATPEQIAFAAACTLTLYDARGHALSVVRGLRSVPPTPMVLAAGAYRVRLETPDATPDERTVQVVAGRLSRVSFTR